MKLDSRELGTVLAALRWWQVSVDDLVVDAHAGAYGEIATNGDTVQPLNSNEIDDLCERLNCD